ncbi:hypothetical protein [Candidatus Electrothrix sp.]|uniref:hypothetical protein n=1 Tax=Candidatus Electrothrix sp. TaxID=2170559 RepID=UPI00405678AC
MIKNVLSDKASKKDMIESAYERGIEQGTERGIAKGMEKGVSQGEQKGRAERKREIAIKLLASGNLDTGAIAEITGLSIKEFQGVQQICHFN